MRLILAACVALAATAAIRPASAQQPVQVSAEGIIAARQAAYDLMGANAADIKRAIDSKTSDVKPYAANAKAISKWAKNVPAMFPTGTEQGGDTKALPAIWSDRSGFEAAAAKLVSASDELAKAAEANDTEAFGNAFKAVGGACGNCHKNYRAK